MLFQGLSLHWLASWTLASLAKWSKLAILSWFWSVRRYQANSAMSILLYIASFAAVEKLKQNVIFPVCLFDSHTGPTIFNRFAYQSYSWMVLFQSLKFGKSTYKVLFLVSLKSIAGNVVLLNAVPRLLKSTEQERHSHFCHFEALCLVSNSNQLPVLDMKS